MSSENVQLLCMEKGSTGYHRTFGPYTFGEFNLGGGTIHLGLYNPGTDSTEHEDSDHAIKITLVNGELHYGARIYDRFSVITEGEVPMLSAEFDMALCRSGCKAVIIKL